jgi:hypothetical protein
LKRIAIILATIMFGLLLHFQPAQAEIYKWIDEKGTVHFTEDTETIPERYRKNVESRTTEEDLMSPEERMRIKRESEEQEKEKRSKKEIIKTIETPKPVRPVESEPVDSGPSPGYIPLEKFMHITKRMTEAEVLSRLGPPTREEWGEAKSTGTVSGGTVNGFVSPGGSISGTVSGGSYSGETIVVKRYYYIGDRSKGEQTRVIIFEKGKVVDYKTISP